MSPSHPGVGTPVPSRAALLAGSRYELLVKIATGGTATVYVGRVSGSVGFSRMVAIKRAHPHLRDDPHARAALIREATLASQVHHANVVPIQDVEETEDELLLVMDYIEGGALSDLLEHAARSGESVEVPVGVALRILIDAMAGLTAVHALTDETGRDLGMIHRDVSPQNILVGIDGTARLTDFGLARLTEVSASATATVKGKIAYMAPEYIEGELPTRVCDVFSMGVVVWETLAGRRLFRGTNDADTLRRVVACSVPRLSTVRPALPEPFDAVLARALARDPSQRYRSVAAFAAAFSDVANIVGVGTAADVGALVRDVVGKTLTRRRDTIRMMHDPENATGSMLLDELPIPGGGMRASVPGASSVPPPRSSVPGASSVPPPRSSVPGASSVPSRSSVPPPRSSVAPPARAREPEPTLRMADIDEPEAETLKTTAKNRAGSDGRLVALAVAAVALVGIGAWGAFGDDAGGDALGTFSRRTLSRKIPENVAATAARVSAPSSPTDAATSRPAPPEPSTSAPDTPPRIRPGPPRPQPRPGSAAKPNPKGSTELPQNPYLKKK